MEKYLKLTKQYPDFYYRGYNIQTDEDSIKIVYDFETKDLCEFHPQWIIPYNNECIDRDLLENIVFNLGMVELVSYWKITCSPNVHVMCGNLSQEQITWWKKLYFKGLGEFFYVNSISADPDAFMKIFSSGLAYKVHNGVASGDKILIPVGGGKDSSVTIELLKEHPAEKFAYIINSRGATQTTVEVAGMENRSVLVKRTLDHNMLELNKKGFLNGHTPFSALVAFSSLLVSHIFGMKYVALSNESSANESTVDGSDVNHQYSKSFEFEQDFNEYEKKFINSGVKYFSFLRPLSEFQIAMLFSRFTAYHDIFRSCNAGSKEDIWCCRCPKCLFVFLIMSPHINHTRLIDIFGSDMLNDPDMLEDFKKLIGIVPEKPFECVGSRDEINFSIIEAIKHYDTELPLLFKFYVGTGLYEEYSHKINHYYEYYDNENYLNPEFENILKNSLKGE